MIRPVPDRGPDAPPRNEALEALGVFAGPGRARYVAIARARLASLGIGEAVLAAEGAVQQAWVRLCRQIEQGRIPPMATAEEWEGSFVTTLLQVIADCRRRQSARKRMAPERDPRDPAEIDPVDTRAPSPSERAAFEDEVRRLLALLGTDRKGSVLGRVLLLRIDGYSNREIAARLGLKDVTSVERKLRKIRSILGPLLDGYK